ncbi:MAG TPA: hydrolase TatD [Gammaproteobacteria bacterium]|jgi:TatD DNase family protein|nr:TatD family hydrolase [Gammaproteobacteria bacterium]MDP6731745.1 TatD family hydrolase [Gammaproteobacteria bacterium]HAJ75413.1 hydrolase TatD [Gammaproteobacteria bacterium]|tara:strand:+ start:478 stop:1284 length:807 start_codon:yes stop_codon:yes gene_type:complete
MKLVDIGANLTHKSFEADFDRVVEDATAAGLVHIILTGTDLPTSKAALALSENHPDLFSATVGYHPHIAESVSTAHMAAATELAGQAQVVAIGETGLDFNRNYSPPDRQLAIFERHLELAVEVQKPVFLHQRDAHEAFHDLLRRYRPRLSGGVVHCFTDCEAALMDYIELDMHIGITGWICDERRGELLQTLVSKIPADRLLIETDAPYLLPRSLQPKPRSRRNEPKYLLEVLNTVARHRLEDAPILAKQTTENAMRLFGLNNKPVPD